MNLTCSCGNRDTIAPPRSLIEQVNPGALDSSSTDFSSEASAVDTPWFENRLWVCILLIIIPPFGLVGLSQNSLFSKRAKINIVALLVTTGFISSYFLIPHFVNHASQLNGNKTSISKIAAKPDNFSKDITAECIKLSTEHSSKNYRFFRYSWVDIDFGKGPPSSILVSGSTQSEDKNYILRSIKTKKNTNPHTNWRLLLKIIYILLFTISIMLLGGFIISFEETIRDDTEVTLILLSIVLIVYFSAILIGHFSGSNFIFDNASGKTLELHLNGKFYQSIPPKGFITSRVSTRKLDIEVYESDTLIESAQVNLDKNWWKTFIRALFGRGNFVYNIGAMNSYSISTASYSRSK